ncbi:hypothetical protein PHLH8_33780 [Pseudomonas sp. Pc102]|nr:hypothetical protein PHLH8_33780 [Pseudomonas sp. Pc102]
MRIPCRRGRTGTVSPRNPCNFPPRAGLLFIRYRMAPRAVLRRLPSIFSALT